MSVTQEQVVDYIKTSLGEVKSFMKSLKVALGVSASARYGCAAGGAGGEPVAVKSLKSKLSST